MAPPGESKDGFVAKAAGVAVVGGIAWSIFKSFTTSTTSSPPPSSLEASAHKQTYHVSQGDTLFSLSHRFGVLSLSLSLSLTHTHTHTHTHTYLFFSNIIESPLFQVPIDDLKAANRVHGDDIFAGDELVIPK
ncbi:hypothetical protein L7F22_057318 [Adiantum nelumboides]|nr:hypothetical protein [Adiantum nelumboides]